MILFDFIKLNLRTKRFFSFSGRSPRIEYIGYFIFVIIFSILFTVISPIVMLILMPILSIFHGAVLVPVVLGLLVFYLVFPIIPISVRRLHDIGLSGKLMLFPFLLFIGTLAIVVILSGNGLSIDLITGGAQGKIIKFIGVFNSVVQTMLFLVSVFVKGDEGDNRYGPSLI